MELTRIMSALKDFKDFIRDKIKKERWTHKQISAFLEENHPGQRGFSVRSMETFCSYKGIHNMSQINDNKLDEAISNATDMVKTVSSVSVGRLLGRVWKLFDTACIARGADSSPTLPGSSLLSKNHDRPIGITGA